MILLVSPACYGDKPLKNLSELRWLNRIVLLHLNNSSQPYIRLFERYEEDIVDRDIVWFIIGSDDSDTILTNYKKSVSAYLHSAILNQYEIEKGTVWLIGKDGGVKARYSDLDMNTLFLDIDAMPMRRSEMQNQ